MFGWGTSGYNNTANDTLAINYQPWANCKENRNNIKIDSTLNCEMQHITGECVGENYTYFDASNNPYGYGPSTNMEDRHLTGTSANYDWGVYNAISNGGNKIGMWRTLTSSEWDYLFHARKNAQYLWSRGTVNGVRGIILLSDDFVKPASVTWTPAGKEWTANKFNAEQWEAMEIVGAVFLPAAGFRNGQNVYSVQIWVSYWSSTAHYSSNAYHLGISDDIRLYTTQDNVRFCGHSVRLVQDL